MTKKSPRGRLLASVVVGTGVVIALAVGAVINPVARLDARHCIVDREPRKSLVVALDISDALIAAQPREVGYQVEQALAGLAPGDRVVVLDAAGKAPAEVTPVVDQCVPGNDTNTTRNAFKNAVLRPIAAHLEEVKTKPASPESPLAETIVSVAADISLHAPETVLDILLISDGLQNTTLQSAYRSGSVFPKLEGSPLKGITVDLFLVLNERDLALQPRAVERFIAWLEQSGAKVRFSTPAWLVLAKARYGGGSK